MRTRTHLFPLGSSLGSSLGLSLRLSLRLSLGLSLVFALACKPKGEPAICPAEIAAERADEDDTRELPTWVWFQRLIPRIKLPELLPPEVPRYCAPTHERSEASLAADPRSAATRLPLRPLTDADLTFAEGPDGSLLVWARIFFYDDGSAEGPVALARWVDRGIEFRGLGTLWMPHRQPRLRIEPFGDDDHVLIADAVVCPADKPNDSAPCGRELHVMPLIDQRFKHAELVVDGQLEGPARILTFERLDDPLGDGWVRRSEIRRSLRVREGKAMIAETIRIRECDPETEMKECGGHERTSRYERALTWEDKERSFFFHTTASAWPAEAQQ